MADKITEKRIRPKFSTTPAIKRDMEIAQKAPDNVVPTIQGAHIRVKKVHGRAYYYLVKSYRQGKEIYQVTLRYYGNSLPRRSK